MGEQLTDELADRVPVMPPVACLRVNASRSDRCWDG